MGYRFPTPGLHHLPQSLVQVVCKYAVEISSLISLDAAYTKVFPMDFIFNGSAGTVHEKKKKKASLVLFFYMNTLFATNIS